MTWIKTIPYPEADGPLRKLYDRVKGPGDKVDNILLAHSLRPHTLEGHMALYKFVLHHPRNTIAKWFLETLGVYVSLLNGCDYCVEHHFVGLRRLLGDERRAAAIRAVLEAEDFVAVLDGKQAAALAYARRLTLQPRDVVESDVAALRAMGWGDGEILEINQVTAYFSYANRTVLGLGVTTTGDVLGLSPSDSEDTDNWHHR